MKSPRADLLLRCNRILQTWLPVVAFPPKKGGTGFYEALPWAPLQALKCDFTRHLNN